MSLPIYNQIVVINQSTVVTDAQGATMTSALSTLLPTFCSDWKIPVVTARFVAKGANIPANAYKIYLKDNADVSGALAYHDLTMADVPYGNVFAKTVLQYGGVVLYEPTRKLPTVAQALAHEVFELLVDPRCNTWWMNNKTGSLYAAEVCDPVESNAVVVRLANNTNVTMSDWILPAWQDVYNTRGPFNHLDTLLRPFQLSPNGYAIYLQNSNISYVFGESVNTQKQETYMAKNRLGARLSVVIKTPDGAPTDDSAGGTVQTRTA